MKKKKNHLKLVNKQAAKVAVSKNKNVVIASKPELNTSIDYEQLVNFALLISILTIVFMVTISVITV